MFKIALALFGSCFIALNVASSNDALNQIKSLHDPQNPQETIARVDNFIRQNGNNAHAYLLRSTSFIQMERYNEALNDISRSISIQSDNEDAYLLLDIIYERMKNYDGIISNASKMIEIFENREDKKIIVLVGLLKKANAQRIFNDSSNAEITFNKAINIINTQNVPNTKDANDLISEIYLGLCEINIIINNNNDSGIEYCSKAINYNKKNYGAYQNLSAAYINNGKYKEAIDLLKPITFEDRSFASYYNLSIATYNFLESNDNIPDRGNYIDMARKSIDAAISISSSEIERNAANGFKIKISRLK